MLRRKITTVLTPGGIEQRYAEGSAYIPWSDIEKVGIVSMLSNKMVGIRLKNYDDYLEAMSPSLAEYMTKSLPYMKLLAVPHPVSVWSKLQGHDLKKMLKSFGKVGNLAEMLLWTREQYGYDFLLTWAEIDRPARDLLTYWKDTCHQRGRVIKRQAGTMKSAGARRYYCPIDHLARCYRG